jgi:hypothetical protein
MLVPILLKVLSRVRLGTVARRSMVVMRLPRKAFAAQNGFAIRALDAAIQERDNCGATLRLTFARILMRAKLPNRSFTPKCYGKKSRPP